VTSPLSKYAKKKSENALKTNCNNSYAPKFKKGIIFNNAFLTLEKPMYKRNSFQIFMNQGPNEENNTTYIDLSGDKGVEKRILVKGSGKYSKTNDLVKVDYQGTLSSGDIFDSSISRGEPFTFRIGEGKVIKGWEIALQSMKVGEKSSFKISSFYAYKKKGIPPIIPPNADLTFEISLLEIISDSSKENSIYEGKMIENRNSAESIRLSSNQNTKKREDPESGIFSKFFFISPFQSQTGEQAPWILNPNITFSLVFVIIFLVYYLILQLGVIHIGYIGE
jgi:FKBP-type peptidyl-prolyl cis-trans isomerase